MDLADSDVRRHAAGITLLNLFGGPSREDGIDVFVRKWGAEMVVYDIEISPSHDLCDEGLWQTIRSDIENGKYDGALTAPPCGTFCANRGKGAGPRVLRTEWPPDLYGIKGLEPHEKELVRMGTCLALRSLEVAQAFESQNKPFGWEQPKRRDGAPSMFKLTEIGEFLKMSKATFRVCVQCVLGAVTSKPTEILHFLMDLSMLTEVCPHPRKWWVLPWNGRAQFSAHPPLRGRQWMVPWDDWRPWMTRYREPPGQYLTKNAAHYPGGMNQVLADQLVRGAVAARLRRSQASSMVKTGKWMNTLVATDRLHTPDLGHGMGAMLGRSSSSIGPLPDQTVVHKHITGLPKVVHALPLRGPAPPHLWVHCMTQTRVWGGWLMCGTQLARWQVTNALVPCWPKPSMHILLTSLHRCKLCLVALVRRISITVN